MLVVALLPLAAFAALVLADLGAVSHSTVDETYRTLLETQERAQQQYLDNQASLVGVRLQTVVEQLDRLRARVGADLPPPRADAPARPEPGAARGDLGLTGAGSMLYAQSPTPSRAASTLLVGPSSRAAPSATLDASQQDAVGFVSRADLEQAMESLRASNPAVRGVWIADPGTDVVRAIPGIDVADSVEHARIDTRSPVNRSGGAPFSSLAERTADAGAEPPAWEGDTALAPATGTGAEFSTTYATRVPDEAGVSIYERVGAGSAYVVGVDVEVHQLVGDEVAVSRSDQKGAYSLLLGSDGRLLAGGDGIARDFNLGPHAVGTRLAIPAGPLRDGLGGVLQGGVHQTIRADLGGSAHEVFTTPLKPAHWVLASAVPARGLLPDQAALRRGIDTGIRHVLRDGSALAILLCGLAFLLATLISRRLVGPVRALTVEAERLGAGRIDEPVSPQGTDEVGLLAASLERMRREVSSSRNAILAAAHELEGRVELRTAELRIRNEELVALNALAGSLTRSLDPPTLLADALDTLGALLPLERGRAYLSGPDGLVALEETAGEEEGGGELDDRLAATASAAVEAHDLVVREAPSGTLVGLPLETSHGPHGAIALRARRGWRPAVRSRALLRAVADQVGLALRTAALSAEGKELAVLEERTRLAREIHDTIAQQLTAVIIQLEAAEAFVRRDQGRAQRLVVEARDLARQALQEARRSVWDLRPTPLDATGLGGAIAAEARRLARRGEAAVRVRNHVAQRDLSLAPETEVALFRIVQEALGNAIRHSRAEHIEVLLERRHGHLCVEVSDDGVGIENPDGAPPPGRFGLVGMRERARLVGGELVIESRPGVGTRVEVRLPWPASQPEAVSA